MESDHNINSRLHTHVAADRDARDFGVDVQLRVRGCDLLGHEGVVALELELGRLSAPERRSERGAADRFG